ncbi:hypothetical protein [Nocardia cyriacigeorgica]|uniref:hypothetical protein n=1 Tax=Nocardia cyriacigeorgica TaxID=135487 RepID=UPI002457C1B2|nr:hypothetical protein [Nocardia cyriacigeorgica]
MTITPQVAIAYTSGRDHTTVLAEAVRNAAAATTPADLPADQVHKADIATVEFLGRRVAEHTAIVLAGRAALAH